MKIRTAVFRLIHQKREAVINICGEGECPQNKETLLRYDQVIKLTVLEFTYNIHILSIASE